MTYHIQWQVDNTVHGPKELTPDGTVPGPSAEEIMNNSTSPPLKKQRANLSSANHIGAFVTVCLQTPRATIEPPQLCDLGGLVDTSGRWQYSAASHLCLSLLLLCASCCISFCARQNILLFVACRVYTRAGH